MIILYLFFFLVQSCQPSEYRCKNNRCIPKSAHNCDIDWCGDGSGCERKPPDPDIALIAGLCGGIGVLFIGLFVGVIVAANRKPKEDRVRQSAFLCLTGKYDTIFSQLKMVSYLSIKYKTAFKIRNSFALFDNWKLLPQNGKNICPIGTRINALLLTVRALCQLRYRAT